MNTFSVDEAKTHLSRLLQRAAAGEEMIITRAGKPVAKLTPSRPSAAERVPGQDVGKLWIADDFNALLREGLLEDFQGG